MTNLLSKANLLLSLACFGIAFFASSVEVFLNTIGGASMYRLRAGNATIGQKKSNT